MDANQSTVDPRATASTRVSATTPTGVYMSGFTLTTAAINARRNRTSTATTVATDGRSVPSLIDGYADALRRRADFIRANDDPDNPDRRTGNNRGGVVAPFTKVVNQYANALMSRVSNPALVTDPDAPGFSDSLDSAIATILSFESGDIDADALHRFIVGDDAHAEYVESLAGDSPATGDAPAPTGDAGDAGDSTPANGADAA